MKRRVIGVFLAVAMAASASAEDRWVFMPCNFWGGGTNLHSLAYFTNTVGRARKAGYNGVLLSCHFDVAHQWPRHLTNQLDKAKAFCDDIGMEPGQAAGPDEVEATADRLYTGSMGFDPQHWYRMQHHFPVIDEDNYDRFAALVIADLRVGPLHDAAVNGGDMLLVGEPDPLMMTPEQREKQHIRRIDLGGELK